MSNQFKATPYQRKTYVLDECPLVLERVTLAEVVELVVEVLVNLSAGTVLDKQPAEDSQATHPQDLAVRGKLCQHGPSYDVTMDPNSSR